MIKFKLVSAVAYTKMLYLSELIPLNKDSKLLCTAKEFISLSTMDTKVCKPAGLHAQDFLRMHERCAFLCNWSCWHAEDVQLLVREPTYESVASLPLLIGQH